MNFQMINSRTLSFIALFSMAYIAFFYGSNDSSVHLYQQSEVDKAVIWVGVTAKKLAMIDDSELLQNQAVNLKKANDNILDIKILKLSGAKIIASTQHADEDKNFPFRLPKDQKSLFDKAKQIKAAYKKSLSGQFLNPIINYEWRETNSENIVQVIYPYVIKGDFKGVVQMEVMAAAKITQAYHFIDWLVLLLVALALLNFFDKKQLNDVRLKYFTVTKNTLTSCGYAAIFLAASLLMCFLLVHEFQLLQSATINTLMELLNSVESESLKSNTLWIDRYGQDMQRLDGLSQPFYLQWMESNLRGLIAQFTAYILFSIFLLVFFVSGSAAKTRQAFKDNRQAYMYVLPAMLGMLVLVFFPFSYGVLLSFTDTTMFNESLPFSERFVGLDNYLTILGDFNLFKELDGQTIINYENFYWTLFITICWTVSNVVFAVGLGLLLALALNDSRIKFRWFFRVVLILPWAIPNYITALVWKGMFHQQFGVINQVIQIFGFEPIDWFGSVFTSFLTGLTTNVWLGFPFMMVVILGGLQSISTDMYEAAKIDGANRWQQFKYITLPSLKPTLIPAIILSVVWTFNMFNVIYLVSAGEPAGANEILITQAYKIGFEKMQYAYAAAYSVVIFMILLVYGVFQNKVSKVTDANS